jgi:hypothetical protein
VATIQGTRLTLSDTVGLAVDMSPVIQLIDPFDVGVLSYFGMDSLDKQATETTHQWMEDSLRPLTSTIVDNPLGAGATTINVAASTGTYFRAQDVVLIDTEQIRLTADPAVDVLTTVASPNGRGWGGSTAASHTQNSIIEIIGVAYLEGNPTPGVARSVVKTSKSNQVQIFEEVVQVSSTLEAVEQWAPGSEYARQLSKAMKSLMILIDKTFIYGKPTTRTATVPGSMGGIRHFITTNVTSASGTQISEKLLQDSLNLTYDAGGHVKSLFMRLRQKQGVNKFLDDRRRTTMEDRRAGALVDFYDWDMGSVDIVVDRWLPVDEVLGLDNEHIGFGPLVGQALAHEILPKVSRLVQRGEITGEYTAEVKSETAHFRLTTLATQII